MAIAQATTIFTNHMNTSIKTILAAITIGATAIAAQAQTTTPTTTNGQPMSPRIVTIDIGYALTNYYRSVEESAKLQTYGQQAQKTVDDLVAQARTMADQFKAAQDAFNNPIATADAKKTSQDKMQSIYQDLQKKEQEINDTRQSAYNQLQQTIAQTRQQLIIEIAAKAADIGKAKGATMIADRGSLVYADPAMDITNEVIAALNQGHPMPVATGTGAPAAVAPAGAPAAPTFPGAGN